MQSKHKLTPPELAITVRLLSVINPVLCLSLLTAYPYTALAQDDILTRTEDERVSETTTEQEEPENTEESDPWDASTGRLRC